MPDVPELADISKFSIKRDEKILEEIIKPKDDIIKELYNDNLALYREISKQSRAIIFKKKHTLLLIQNNKLNTKKEKKNGIWRDKKKKQKKNKKIL